MSEWVKWTGGKMPVAGYETVEVQFGVGTDKRPADQLRWSWDYNGTGGDIRAYRLSGDFTPASANDNRPQFDAMQPEQEALAIDISLQIAKGARPDPVQILEWARALYEAEMGAEA